MTRPLPPRPRAAFRVAVVGHRRDKLPVAAEAEISASLTAVLDLVATAVIRHVECHRLLYRDAPPVLTLLSGLAEGADRLGALAARHDARWRLHAVLPFAPEQYLGDFLGPTAGPESAEQFAALLAGAEAITVLDGRPGRWDAYIPLGRILVESCDLLVAVWDGADAAGPGGTANIVRCARALDVPVVRINPARDATPWLEDTRAKDAGRAGGVSGLADRLDTLLRPPADHALVARWYAERAGPRRTPALFDAVIRALEWFQPRSVRAPSRLSAPLPLDPGAAARAGWAAAFAELPRAVSTGLAERFAPLFGWADALGQWYAGGFRRTFTLLFILAVVSVATGSLLTLRAADGGQLSAVALPVIEPLLLGWMLVVVSRGRSRGLHERWLDYRALAERTRHLAMLWPLGRTPSVVRVGPQPVDNDPRMGWVGWLLRATAREAGLVPGRLDGDYPERIRTTLIQGEVRSQRSFHQQRHTRLGRLSDPLERLARNLVVLALLLSVGRLFGLPLVIQQALAGAPLDKAHEVTLESGVWRVMGAIANALPALAAGIHGFLGLADFEGTALRSAAIEGRLADFEGRLARLDPPDLTSLGDLAVAMVEAEEGELGAWHSATASRRLQAG